jgi:Ca2+-binding RTX toxin-like protein
VAKGVARRRFTGTSGVAALACVLLFAPAAVAAPGDIYVSDEDVVTSGPGSGAIVKFGPSGGAGTVLSTSEEYGDPAGLALFPDGRLVLADSGADVIFFVDPATGAATNLGNGGLLGLPRDVAVTADRKLLVVSEDGDRVVHYDPVTAAFSPYLQLPADSQLRSIVTTRDGGAYLSAGNQGLSETTVYRISPQRVATTFLTALGLGDGEDMTLSADERTLLISTEADGTVLAVDTATAASTVRATADSPVSAAALPDGTLIVSDRGVDGLRRVPPGGSTGDVFTDAADLFSSQGDVLVEPERCAGLVPTVVGTDGDDVLLGSVFDDVILTLGGSDVVGGLSGNDVVCGGTGADTLRGGPGNDMLLGGSGPDRLRGKAGRDALRGNAGRDVLVGGKGKDSLRGGKGRDRQKQ